MLVHRERTNERIVLAEHMIEPILIDIDGQNWVDMGTGMLADILAASAQAGAIPGKAMQSGDSVYYFHLYGYGHLAVIITIKRQQPWPCHHHSLPNA